MNHSSDGPARGDPFEPSGAVTGIGSLPITDPVEAIDFVGIWCPRLPFCPQAPGSDLVAVTLTQLDPGSEAAARFDLFAHAVLDGQFPEAMGLKIQVTGPVTLAYLLGVAGAVETVDAQLLDRLADQVAEIATAQVDRLGPAELPVLVYIDEPALALTGSTAASPIASVLGAIKAAGAIGGVHCCSLTSPEPLAALSGARVASFDATGPADSPTGPRTLVDPEQLVSFGLVRTTGPLPSPGTAFSRWLVDASATGDPCQLARRTIVTATCGLGTVEASFARANFEVATRTGALIEQLARSALPFSAA